MRFVSYGVIFPNQLEASGIFWSLFFPHFNRHVGFPLIETHIDQVVKFDAKIELFCEPISGRRH